LLRPWLHLGVEEGLPLRHHAPQQILDGIGRPRGEGETEQGGVGDGRLQLAIIFGKKTAPYLSPIYAIVEGVVLGTLSALIEAAYPGIVINAVMITMAIFAVMLLIYTTGLIKVTGKVRTGIIAATGGVALLYGVNLLIRAFGGAGFGFIHDSGPLGIAVSVVVCAIAAFNLLLDFEFINEGSRSGAPKYLEWYGAFGLMVTLIWLYLEILRLLAKLRNR